MGIVDWLLQKGHVTNVTGCCQLFLKGTVSPTDLSVSSKKSDETCQKSAISYFYLSEKSKLHPEKWSLKVEEKHI